MLDPHATAIVYRHAVAVHRSVGLDVTSQVKLEAEEVRRRFSHRLLRPVLDFSEVWFRHSGAIIFHDPLAAVSLFDPSVCMFEKGSVEVELSSPRLAGATLWTRDPAGRHEAAFEVTRDLFFDRYFSVFEKSP
jgi:inosine-uridine nucleoside N-ribohydrolase